MTLKNHILRLYAAPLLALLFMLTACQSEEVLPGAEDYPMTFGSNVSTTRANTTDESALNALKTNGFVVYGDKNGTDIFINQEVSWPKDQSTNGPVTSTNNENLWTYTPIKYWDKTSNAKYDFAAYGPFINTQNTSENKTVSYSSPSFTIGNIPQWQDIDGSEYDLLVADNQHGNYKDNFSDGIVYFKFFHKLAQIIVRVEKDAASGIPSVSLGGVPTSTTRTYSRDIAATVQTDVFSSVDASSEFDVYTKSDSETLEEDGNYNILAKKMVVPFTSETIKIKVGETLIPTDLKAISVGSIYYINLKVGVTGVYVDVEVQGWDNVDPTDDHVYNW